mmetsp:Transcript_47871/g.55944  ORF Transcript_47871/g.55944 Transcript_47871/m.55944 type:complete len:154 (-) Transcript_47871:355-816(-)
MLSNRNFNGNDYEGLLRYDEETGGPNQARWLNSMSREEIERCPQAIVGQEDYLLGSGNGGGKDDTVGSTVSSTSGGEARRRKGTTVVPITTNSAPTTSTSTPAQSCPICLEPYQPGDSVRTIPCFRAFHVHCIDSWLLESRAECPVCKTSAIG